MRRILDDDEPLTLVMAHRFDLGEGAIAVLRRAVRNVEHPDLAPIGRALVRRVIFSSYVDARDAGRGDDADKLIKLATPSPVVSGAVVIKPARRRRDTVRDENR
jgi:hypothetical protein